MSEPDRTETPDIRLSYCINNKSFKRNAIRCKKKEVREPLKVPGIFKIIISISIQF